MGSHYMVAFSPSRTTSQHYLSVYGGAHDWQSHKRLGSPVFISPAFLSVSRPTVAKMARTVSNVKFVDFMFNQVQLGQQATVVLLVGLAQDTTKVQYHRWSGLPKHPCSCRCFLMLDSKVASPVVGGCRVDCALLARAGS
jgi:hypothetical protein